MSEPEVLAAADAVFDAARALRRAADVVDELGALAVSSLPILDDAASDTFYTHQAERQDVYFDSAGEHLRRLRRRSAQMNELGEDLARHLSAALSAIEFAGHELGRGTDGNEICVEIRALRTQIDVLSEVVALARPDADRLTRHAQHAGESSAATAALMLMHSRVRQVEQEVDRTDKGVSLMRSVIESARSRGRSSAELAGSPSYAAVHPPPARPPPSPDKPAGPGIAI